MTETDQTFVRVYRLPEQLTHGFCFGSGVPITIMNVDWFNVPTDYHRETLLAYIRNKRYYDARAHFLVLEDHPDFTFVIPAEGDSA